MITCSTSNFTGTIVRCSADLTAKKSLFEWQRETNIVSRSLRQTDSKSHQNAIGQLRLSKKRLYPNMQVRAYCQNNKGGDYAGGDMIKGNQVGGSIIKANHVGGDLFNGDKVGGNKEEVKGDKAGRDINKVGPGGSGNTGTIVNIRGGAVFLMFAVLGTAGYYCYNDPDHEICKMIRSKLMMNKE